MYRSAAASSRGTRYDFSVPCVTPPTTVLNFKDEKTPEAKLEKLLLSDKPVHSVIAVTGISGIGKTTVINAVCKEGGRVQEVFSQINRVYLGSDATPFDLFDNLLNLLIYLYGSRGETKVPDIASHTADYNRHARAMELVYESLLEIASMVQRPLLLIVENASFGHESCPPTQKTLAPLAKLVSLFLRHEHEASIPQAKLLISSTDAQLANQLVSKDSLVALEPMSSYRSQQILYRYAMGPDEIEFQNVADPLNIQSCDNSQLHSVERRRDAIEYILEKCADIPISLAMAGNAVYRIGIKIEAGSKNDINPAQEANHKKWISFAKSLEKESTDLDKKDEPTFPFISLSLKQSDEYLNTIVRKRHYQEAVTTMYRSFAVVKSGQNIDGDAASHFWRMSQGHDILAYTLSKLLTSLGEANLMSQLDELSAPRKIPDSVLSYCKFLAGETTSLCALHNRIIDSYKADIGIGTKGQQDDVFPWWNKKYEKSEYILGNLTRHLFEANALNELLRLVVDFRWIQRVISRETFRFQTMVADLRFVAVILSKFSSEDSELKDNTMHLYEDVSFLLRTAELCASESTRCSLSECTFQLYGRLIGSCEGSVVLSRLIATIDNFAQSYWGRPMSGMLRKPCERLKRVLSIESDVRIVAAGPNSHEVVVGGWRGELGIVDGRSGTMIRRICSLPSTVTCIVLDRPTSNRIAAGCRKGYVQMFDIRIDNLVWKVEPFQGSTSVNSDESSSEEVTSLAFIGGGQFLVCGSSSGRISVLNAEDGETILERRELTRSTGHVLLASVQYRAEDLLIASAGPTVMGWETAIDESGKLTMTTVPSSDEHHGKKILCIAVDSVGAFFATGSEDKGLVLCSLPSRARTGDQERQDQCSWNLEHNSFVTAVAFSWDGRYLFSASSMIFGDNREGNVDDTIRVWDVKSRQCIWKPLRHHTRLVLSIAVSPDGRELYSPSNSVICVWDASQDGYGGNQESPRHGLPSTLSTFALFPKKYIVVTSSSHGLIQFWDSPRLLPSTQFGPIQTRHSRITKIAVSPKEDCIAYCSCNLKIFLVRISENATDHGEPLQCLNDLNVWMMTSERNTAEDEFLMESIKELKFSHNGSTISSLAQYRIMERLEQNVEVSNAKIWDVESGETKPQFSISQVDRQNARISSTGVKLTVSQNGEASSQLIYLERPGYAPAAIGRLEKDVKGFEFDPKLNRLWVLCETLGYVDLVDGCTALSSNTLPPPPRVALRRRSNTKASFFISHAGETKKSFAIPLLNFFKKRGFGCFLDEFSLKPSAITNGDQIREAIMSTDVALFILSPEFVSKEWPLWELKLLLERWDRSNEDKVMGPVLYPIFYDLTVQEAYNPESMPNKSDKTRRLFLTSGFFKLRREGEFGMSCEDAFRAVRRLCSFIGERNDGVYSPKLQVKQLVEEVGQAAIMAHEKNLLRFT